MDIKCLTPETSAEALLAALRTDGALVVEDVIDPDMVARVREEYAPYLASASHGRDRFEGTHTRRLGALLVRCPTVRNLVVMPRLLDVARGLFSGASTVQLNATQLVALSPGEAPQPLHRDQWAWDQFNFPQGYEVELSTMWAFTDFTKDNGATRVALGSHCHESRPEEAALSLAEMKAGSVLFYTGSVFHGAGPNRTDEIREGMILSYTRGWLRPHENQFLNVPIEDARSFPETLQRLIGYERGAYAIGYYGDLQDPIEAVRPNSGAAGLGGTVRIPSKGY